MTVLPPAPNWFSAQILRCSNDGHMAYGARNTVVVLRCEPAAHYSLLDDSPPSSERDHGSENSNWRRSPPLSGVPPALIPSELAYPVANIVTTAFSIKAKVSSVSWSPDSSQLVAASDDGHVKLMKIEDVDKGVNVTYTHVHTMHKELGKDRHKVNTVSWSRPDPDVVVSGDEMGNMVIWDVKTNSTRSVTIGRHNIFVLETHPHFADIVGFGCRLGLVFVVNISGTGKVIQKIRGHDEDIQGLSWSPSKFRDVLLDTDHRSDSLEEESLLAVSSRDKTITVWSAKTGNQVAHLRLPGTSGSSKAKQDNKMSWTTCFWWKKNILLSSGVHGELLEWNLSRLVKRTPDGILRGGEGQSELQVVHKEHARTLYSIHTTGASIQTSGQDRSIVSFHWNSHSLDFHLPAFAAWVYSIAPNCLDPSVIAIGAADAQIRVWKMRSNKAMFDVNTIWQKLNSAKVTALAWHPDKENILAFGTDEGRVGVLDAFSNRSVPTFCDYKHRSTVYNLCFGPAVSSGNGASSFSSGDHKDSHGKKWLFSCGDGLVMMHSARQEGNKTVNIDDIISATNGLVRKQPNRSDVTFQPHEYRFMVLGSNDGLIEILSVPRLEVVCILKSFQKLVQSLAWHPMYVGASTRPSTYKWWLATASNELDIHVWDLSSQLEPRQETSDLEPLNTSTEKGDAGTLTSPILTEPTVMLSGHHQRVIFLNWSPHEDAKLLSVSYDCTAQVWDVCKGVPICNFSRHSDRLFCGLWSPIDPDVIFTGGEDSTVFGWKISDQTDTLPQKKLPLKKVVAKKPKEPKDVESLNDALTMLEAKRREIMMDVDATSSNGSECRGEVAVSAVAVADLKPTRRRQKKRAYFPLSFQKENGAKANAYEDCQELFDFLYGDSQLASSQTSQQHKHNLINKPHLGFFSDKFCMDNLLDLERKCLKDQGAEDVAAHLSLWSGNLSETIKSAIDNGKLNDWLVSMSAGISYALWKEACTAYATQLIKEEDVVKGASYFLMTHHVLQAIEALRNHHFYRAAVAIAKSRLPDNVPLLQELYTAWAFQSSNDGSYELAAKCWIAAGELSQAASLLAKRPDQSSLRVSSILAMKAGEYEKCRTLATQCAALCVKNRDWKCMELLTSEVKLAEICQTWDQVKRQMQGGEEGGAEEEEEEEEEEASEASSLAEAPSSPKSNSDKESDAPAISVAKPDDGDDTK